MIPIIKWHLMKADINGIAWTGVFGLSNVWLKQVDLLDKTQGWYKTQLVTKTYNYCQASAYRNENDRPLQKCITIFDNYGLCFSGFFSMKIIWVKTLLLPLVRGKDISLIYCWDDNELLVVKK